MITKVFAENFANDWISYWNTHNMDKILSLYANDFIIESPKALDVLPESKGVVSGKENIKCYWLAAMRKTPGLKFQMLNLFIGVNGISIHHLNTATNIRAIEVLNFNEDMKVKRVEVYHAI